MLGLIKNATTRAWVNAQGSFAIYSLIFFLHSAPVAQFPVEILVALAWGSTVNATKSDSIGETPALSGLMAYS
jgi:hypothetical protein